MNNVVLIGRMTKDPELRYIPQSETAVANFTLAVDRPISKEKAADFIRIVAFGKTAELCEKYLSKGRLVGIIGAIHTGSYEDKDGKKVYTTEVYADRVEFLDKGEKSESQERGFKAKDENQDPKIPEGFAAMDDDDIPF